MKKEKKAADGALTAKKGKLTDTSLLLIITVAVFFVMYIGAMVFLQKGFLKPQTFFNILNANAALIITACGMSLVMITGGRAILSLFVSGDPREAEQVLDIAYHYLFLMAVFLVVLYLLYVFRSAIQGLGNTVIPMASGIVEFFMRVGAAMVLPLFIGQTGIFYAEISAWSGAALLLAVSYFWLIRKY